MPRTLSLLALLLGAFLNAAEATEPKVGERHPELRLPTIDGDRTVSLHALRGKRVLLLQFASW